MQMPITGMPGFRSSARENVLSQIIVRATDWPEWGSLVPLQLIRAARSGRSDEVFLPMAWLVAAFCGAIREPHVGPIRLEREAL
jgi:hypothetical protein